MAVINIQKKSNVSGVLDSPVINPTGNMFGTSSGSPVEIDPSIKDSQNQNRSYDTLIEEIRNSEVYKTVYEVFKNGRQSVYWLSMLQGILDSIPRIESHFGESLTHNFEEQYNAMYQEAIQNIRTLYSEYQTWLNTLPISQVQQFADAGYNSSITGQGLSGSSLSPTQSTLSDSGGMPTTNTAEVVGNIANFALSASGGLTSTLSAIADTVLKFRGQSLSEAQLAYDKDLSFQTFKKEMASNGVLIKSASWSELNDKDPNWNMSAGAKAKNLYNEWSYVDNFYKYSPELSAFNVEQGLTDNMRSIGRLQLGLRLAEMNHQIDRRNVQMPLELEEDKLVDTITPSVDDDGNKTPSPLNPIGYGVHLLKKLGSKLRNKFKKD